MSIIKDHRVAKCRLHSMSKNVPSNNFCWTAGVIKSILSVTLAIAADSLSNLMVVSTHLETFYENDISSFFI